MRKFCLLLVLGLVGILASCSVENASPTPLPVITPSASATLTPTVLPTGTGTPTPTPTSLPCISPPLYGFTMQELPDFISSPFEAPTRGYDNGHHGVDFAYYRHGGRVGMVGHPVQAVLAGRVAVVLDDRWPYGNAIIIETSLTSIPASWSGQMEIPTSAPTILPGTSPLTLPALTATPAWDESGDRSLYLMYAHLNSPPLLLPGDFVGCGDIIGEVGNTGRSSNAHLHLELRVGPAELSLTSMQHYDNGSTDEEMYNYYVWRVSGLYQVFDPMTLLAVSY